MQHVLYFVLNIMPVDSFEFGWFTTSWTIVFRYILVAADTGCSYHHLLRNLISLLVSIRLLIAGKNAMGIAVRMAINGIADFVLNMNRYTTQAIRNSQTIVPAMIIAFNFA